MAHPSTFSVEAQHQRNLSPTTLKICGANLDLSHIMTSWGNWPLSALLGTCRIFWSRNMRIAPWTRRQESCDATVCLIALLAQFVCWLVGLLSYTGWHTHTHTRTQREVFSALFPSSRVLHLWFFLVSFIFIVSLLHFIGCLLFFFSSSFSRLHWQTVNFQNNVIVQLWLGP